MMKRIPEPKRADRFLTFIFNTAMFFFALVSLPRFCARAAQAKDPARLWKERFGFLDIPVMAGHPKIWIHAVSVGEVMAIQSFVDELRKEIGEASIFISTVTPTGQSVAESFRKKGCHIFYFPFDFSFVTRRVLMQIQPDLVLLAETEIWPNFILQAKACGIPVGVINGRISEKSSEGYQQVLAWIRPIFQSLDFCLVQTPADQERYRQLGVDSDRIHVLGNMKFDQKEKEDGESIDVVRLKMNLGYSLDDDICVAGSTHPGEEKLILQTFKKLQKEFPDLRLVLAPRHPERAIEVGNEAARLGFEPRYYSSPDGKFEEKHILIIDTIGVLKRLYAIAEIVVMGGSFIKHGGQNPIEPALLERPILSGPHIFNFQAVYEALVRGEGAQIVRDSSALPEHLQTLLRDKERRDKMGQNAKRVVETNKGATERHVRWVRNFSNECRGARLRAQGVQPDAPTAMTMGIS